MKGKYQKSLVDHTKRIKMQLTCDEFVMMQAIEDVLYEGKKNNFCSNDDKDIKSLVHKTGFSVESYQMLGKSLKEKGFLVKSEVGEKCYRIGSSWISNYNSEMEEIFERIWERFGKQGNKKNGKKMFYRAMKEVSPEYLWDKIEKYIKHLEENPDKPQMHLSTFMNPESRRFDDEFKTRGIKGKPKNEEQGTAGKFFE